MVLFRFIYFFTLKVEEKCMICLSETFFSFKTLICLVLGFYLLDLLQKEYL